MAQGGIHFRRANEIKRGSPSGLTDGESDYDQKDSQGFINLWGLPDTVQALRDQGKL